MGASKSCEICFEEDVELIDGMIDCEHSFCESCWLAYVNNRLAVDRSSPIMVGCPAAKCRAKLPLERVSELAGSPRAPETLKAALARVMATVPEGAPQCLADFGYEFTSEGKLVNASDQGPFHFVSQSHYDCLGDLVYQHVYGLLKSVCGLVEATLPLNDLGDATCPVFMSPDALTSDRLLLLICGSGAVRAGQWARALCINASLQVGSVLPYVQRAKANGMAVIVLNPNANKVRASPLELRREDFLSTAPTDSASRRRKRRAAAAAAAASSTEEEAEGGADEAPEFLEVPGSETPVNHVLYVWDEFVAKAQARDLAIVAHSAGGHGTMALMSERGEQFFARVRAVAFTDSVHSVSRNAAPEIKTFMRAAAQNWVTSTEPLDTPVGPDVADRDGCPCVSAGHEKHEWTSPSAIESVFAFICSKMDLVYLPVTEPLNYAC